MPSTARPAALKLFSALIVLSLAAPLALLDGHPALAHAHLQAASPADQAKVKTAPEAITLTFSEALSLALSGAAVTAEGNAPITTGPAKLGPEGKSLIIPLTTPLSPGTYKVDWHVLSVDGHKTKGVLHFTVAP